MRSFPDEEEMLFSSTLITTYDGRERGGEKREKREEKEKRERRGLTFIFKCRS